MRSHSWHDFSSGIFLWLQPQVCDLLIQFWKQLKHCMIKISK